MDHSMSNNNFLVFLHHPTPYLINFSTVVGSHEYIIYNKLAHIVYIYDLHIRDCAVCSYWVIQC